MLDDLRVLQRAAEGYRAAATDWVPAPHDPFHWRHQLPLFGRDHAARWRWGWAAPALARDLIAVYAAGAQPDMHANAAPISE